MAQRRNDQKHLHRSERRVSPPKLVCHCHCSCPGNQHIRRARCPSPNNFRGRLLIVTALTSSSDHGGKLRMRRGAEAFLRSHRLAVLLRLFLTLALVSCQSLNYTPPVTPPVSAVKTEQHVDPATLREGRTLFVHRCIECHTLPPLWHYRKEEWPEIVNSMSHRASLSPVERNAIISYILAVRAQH